MMPATAAFVETNKARCRVCYTCVRECPAKAIRIVGGQAEVLAERCIACGNCVRVCSQQAKQAVSTIGQARPNRDRFPPSARAVRPGAPR